MRMTHVSSGLMTTQALTSTPSEFCAAASSTANGTLNPRAKPPLAAAEPTINVRRETVLRIDFFMALLPDLDFGFAVGGNTSRRLVHGGANPLIGAAATDV